MSESGGDTGDGETDDGGNSPIGREMRRLLVVVALGLVLVVAGVALANVTATDGGDTSIETTTFETESGLDLTADVYRPADASADDPRPAVVLIHGAGADRGTMSSFAQEFAKRGYVAVTVDQPGHRDSDPPAGADRFGGPATLSYTRSLDVVDGDRVSLVGHSLGGFASLTAAEDQPDGYRSVVLVSSTWGDDEAIEDVPTANETFPRNMAVVFGQYDEFGPIMWDEDVPGNLPESQKLGEAFPTNSTVETGRTYGSVEDGDARILTQPPTIHGGMHRSTTTVDHTIDWVERTNEPPEDKDPAQSWYWTTLGHILAFLGALVVGVAVTAVTFRRLDDEPEARTDGGTTDSVETGDSSGAWAVSRRTLAGLTLLPALTITPSFFIGQFLIPANRVLHQSNTTAHAVWALLAVAVGAGVAAWRFDGVDTGTVREVLPARAGGARALGSTLAGVAAMYLLILAGSAVPGSGFRAWLLGLGVLPPVRAVSLAVYVLPLSVGTIALAVTLDRVLGDGSLGRTVGRALAVTCGALAVIVVVQYIPLFLGFGMPIPTIGPLVFGFFRAMIYLALAAVVCVVLTRSTDEPLVGGVLSGLLVTALITGPASIAVAPF